MKKITFLATALLGMTVVANSQSLTGTSLNITGSGSSGSGTIANDLTVGDKLVAKRADFAGVGSRTVKIGHSGWSNLGAPLAITYLGGESGTGGPGYSGPITKPGLTINSSFGIGTIGGEFGKPFFGQYESVVLNGYVYQDENRHITYASTNLIVGPYRSSFNYENLFDVKTGIDAGGQTIFDVNKSRTYLSNKLGIGTNTFPLTEVYNLYVKGGIRTEKVKVDLASDHSWGDFVFKPTYELMSLKETETYIQKNSHLPNIPSAKEIETEGLDLGEMQRLQMIKIEELTLYTIAQQKEMEQLKILLEKIIVENQELKTQIVDISSKL